VLDATERIAVATGILNVWMHPADQTAAYHADVTAAHPGRFLLGLGISHAPLIGPDRYRRPMEVMAAYLDGLDQAATPVPQRERVLAALGPRMLTLAKQRSGGAHPYLVTPEHTKTARDVLGDGTVLAPEQAVVLESDSGRAREMARSFLATYLALPNYTNNLRRLGYSADDFAGGGSDRLVDDIVPWGSPATVLRRVAQHHDAGADHVCIQVVTGDRGVFPRQQWRELSAALNEGS
jgi:probable F420-dependent oxidoreductase